MIVNVGDKNRNDFEGFGDKTLWTKPISEIRIMTDKKCHICEAKRCYRRSCYVCYKPICPEHCEILRVVVDPDKDLEGFLYFCDECNDETKFPPATKLQNQALQHSTMRHHARSNTKCAHCRKNPLDNMSDNDLCEECFDKKKCAHCYKYDLFYSFLTKTCSKCDLRACKKHRTCIEVESTTGPKTQRYECKECISD